MNDSELIQMYCAVRYNTTKQRISYKSHLICASQRTDFLLFEGKKRIYNIILNNSKDFVKIMFVCLFLFW